MELLPSKINLGQEDYSFESDSTRFVIDNNNNSFQYQQASNDQPQQHPIIQIITPAKRRPAMSIRIPMKSLSKRYRPLADLGSGSFGTVVLAKVNSGALPTLFEEMRRCKDTLLEPIKDSHRGRFDVVAIKTMNVQLAVEDYSRVKEVKFILSMKSHPSLVQIYDLFIDRTTKRLHIVMESLDQNLYQLMKCRDQSLFSPRTLKSILSQILAGIRHIHKNLYYHRDVKPENILIMFSGNFYSFRENVPQNKLYQPYIVKLADYGLARRVDNHDPYTDYVSTRWYRSPEILFRKPSYSYGIDIWAFGCVAIEAATFCPLFPGENEVEQIWRILEVLGTPERGCFGFQTMGGYWDEGQVLAAKLGFSFPRIPGINVEDLVPRVDLGYAELAYFCQFVKSCLTWNPENRIDVFQLCGLKYFDNTVIREEDEQMLKEQKNSTFFNRSEEFAGLSSLSETLMKSKNRLASVTNKCASALNFGSYSNGPQQQQQKTHINDENNDPSTTFVNTQHTQQSKAQRAPQINIVNPAVVPQIHSNILPPSLSLTQKRDNNIEKKPDPYDDIHEFDPLNYQIPQNANTGVPSQQYPEPLELDTGNYDEDEFDEEPPEPYEMPVNPNLSSSLASQSYDFLSFDKFQENFKSLENEVNDYSTNNTNVHPTNTNNAGVTYANNASHNSNLTSAINYAMDDLSNFPDNNLYDWSQYR
ncbi:unnamed protein product [Ambrosiozyma monospora]|uniref:Unnamed protein product n=1 Tax=Ambrosiozyma monospora TaxID=43982 RepID=A0ACB5SVD4_AMBMO|nr:unnamed protein product [Ambrosiozyma monospora]